MATLCTLTGVLRDRQNTVVANADISFAFKNGVVGSGDVYSPIVETTTTDGSGNISIQLTNGSYTGTLISNGRVETFTLNVPDQASADIGDYIDQDVDQTPALLAQAIAAKDAAEAAAAVSQIFATRSAAVTAWAALSTSEKAAIPAGTIWSWPDFSIVLMPAGHGAYGTDPIADLAGWAPFARVTPFHWGAAGDGVLDKSDMTITSGTDDHEAFQNAIDYLGDLGGGELFVPVQDGDCYRVGAFLKARNGVTVRCESQATWIHQSNDNPLVVNLTNWPARNCWMFGSWDSGNYQSATAYTLNSVTADDRVVTTTTASEAGNFSVGDVILVRSDTTYTVGSNDLPTRGEVNVVTSANASTGVIGLRYAIVEGGSAEVVNLSQDPHVWLDADGTSSGQTMFATRDFKLLGGTWSNEAYNGPFDSAGGLIDCVIAPDVIHASNGVSYGNLKAHSEIRCVSQMIKRTGVELAICSHDNFVSVPSVSTRGDGTYSAAPIQVGEGSKRNYIQVGSINANGVGSGSDSAVVLTVASENLIDVGTIVADSITAAGVYFSDLSYTGTRPNCENNIVRIGSLHCSSATSAVKFFGNGQLGRNVVQGGNFYGTFTNAIELEAGTGSENVVTDAWFETGRLRVADGGDSYTIRAYVPDGIQIASDWDAELRGGEAMLETTASRLLRQTRTARASHNATNASPSTTTVTVPAGSLDIGDEVEFFLSAAISGGSSSDNKTFLVSFAGTSVKSYVTTSTGPSEVLIRGSITRAAFDTAAIGNLTIFQDDATVATEVKAIGSLDMSNNDYDLVLSVTPTNAGDTIIVRYVRIWPRKMNAGGW